jgi:plastocyanin
MSKAMKLVLALVVVMVVAGVAILFSGKKSNSDSGTANNSSTAKSSATITYNGTDFSPSSVTVTSGGSIKVINDSSAELDFDSDPHPVHTDNPELNAGDIIGGKSKTFTVKTKGEWGYHNHHNPTQGGTIIVE